ncbi:hypothetical protein BDZ91DRAFT_659835, partial [Kalaharituber pfeilii]
MFFKTGLLPKGLTETLKVQFKSGETWRQLIRQIADEPSWEKGHVDFHLQQNVGFYYRNIQECAQYLLRQRAYVDSLVFEATTEYDQNKQRVYSELHTADWWVEKQRLLSPNVTVVPILLASDQTHLTNFSGDKKLWPVYMSIGNIVSRVRNKPSAHAWVPIALLPVNPKRMSGISGWTKKDQGVDSLQVFHDIMRTVLRPLVQLYEAGGVEMLCADEKVRKCVPILCTWHADYMENINIHGIKLNLCPMCTVPKEALG